MFVLWFTVEKLWLWIKYRNRDNNFTFIFTQFIQIQRWHGPNLKVQFLRMLFMEKEFSLYQRSKLKMLVLTSVHWLCPMESLSNLRYRCLLNVSNNYFYRFWHYKIWKVCFLFVFFFFFVKKTNLYPWVFVLDWNSNVLWFEVFLFLSQTDLFENK